MSGEPSLVVSGGRILFGPNSRKAAGVGVARGVGESGVGLGITGEGTACTVGRGEGLGRGAGVADAAGEAHGCSVGSARIGVASGRGVGENRLLFRCAPPPEDGGEVLSKDGAAKLHIVTAYDRQSAAHAK